MLLATCTAHSGAKKAHDWAVQQLADLFRTTHRVKTERVVRRRGQRCGDIEITSYLANESDPVPLVMDLRIVHDRFGSISDPSIIIPPLFRRFYDYYCWYVREITQ